jgi:hypothetical protein
MTAASETGMRRNRIVKRSSHTATERSTTRPSLSGRSFLFLFPFVGLAKLAGRACELLGGASILLRLLALATLRAF